jgi:hypothetical protein
MEMMVLRVGAQHTLLREGGTERIQDGNDGVKSWSTAHTSQRERDREDSGWK